MLNEEKVILMTKMAAFIDREGKNNDAINQMFKNLKTSTQISLKFTMFSAGILFLVACFMNFFFFSFWFFDLKNPHFMQD